MYCQLYLMENNKEKTAYLLVYQLKGPDKDISATL